MKDLGTFCISFQRGEGRSGRVRSGWGQIRFWLPVARVHKDTCGCMGDGETVMWL